MDVGIVCRLGDLGEAHHCLNGVETDRYTFVQMDSRLRPLPGLLRGHHGADGLRPAPGIYAAPPVYRSVLWFARPESLLCSRCESSSSSIP
jgi:hypothetical protein